MKNFADMHTHSIFSIDSKEKIENICRVAVMKGLRAIAITDHIDYNPKDYGFDYYNKEAYMTSIQQAKKDFSEGLLVLSGIEFSEPHLYMDELKDFQNTNYDVILGSIHWLDQMFVGQKELLENHTQIEIEEMYYEMVMTSIEHGGFDVLAHLDFPKRYYGSTTIDNTILSSILKSLVKKNIALEINTSSLRKGLSDCMPSISMVEAYIALGGRRLTLGSDAHVADDVCEDFDTITAQLSEQARQSIGLFISREFITIEDMFGC